MEYILRLLYNYDCEYDYKNKIFYIKKKILVYDFLYIKRILSSLSEKVKDIRVETFIDKRDNYERRF